MDLNKIKAAATTIRSLSMDGVQKANSGHPGLPMGCAELGAVLYGELLNHYPADPDWINRDRFVLSAGHGSMLLYSLLYLSGYGLKKEDLMNFRQLGSPTPGHPEYGCAKGVETTTGPLGAGFSNAVGMAIAEEMLAARFNTAEHVIFEHYTYVLSGDGCMMEGVTAEAASLAGHLKLGKLIVFYDSNHITIEGPTDLAFSEDVLKRFEGYGWQTLSGDAYDPEGIAALVAEAKKETDRPAIIKLSSVIGKGSFSMEGTHGIHGSPLGEDEIVKTREKLGIPQDRAFYEDPEATAYFSGRKDVWKKAYDSWKEMFSQWAAANPRLKKELDAWYAPGGGAFAKLPFPGFKEGEKIATRNASGKVLNSIAAAVPNLVGGSADLAPSTKTFLDDYGDFSAENRGGRNLHFGVREHGMGGVSNGIDLHGGLRAYCSTFLVFADYMRPAVRLAALMRVPVVFVFTHDSIFVGEDGPTHQPVEHVASLRIIPNLVVLRPADAQETSAAWAIALKRTDGPTALALTRQKLEIFPKHDSQWFSTAEKGAYIVKDSDGTPDAVVVATGSEVGPALQAAEKAAGKKVRVVSMISKELFLEQDDSFKRTVIPEGVKTVVAEAGVAYGWADIAGKPENILSIERFGKSAPGGKAAEHLGLTVEALVKIIEKEG